MLLIKSDRLLVVWNNNMMLNSTNQCKVMAESNTFAILVKITRLIT
jgi:hypothetical protein